MNLFEKFLYFLQGEMSTPVSFGWFHLLCIFIMICFAVLLFFKRKNHNEKQLKLILGTYSIIALTLEILKQIIWAFNYDFVNNVAIWDYEWYSFPFQLCTTPIYVCLICLFLNKGKIRDGLLSYLSYVTILGSIATIVMPDSCFTSDILVNIHTMWLHLGSFVVSVYLLFSREVKINFQAFKQAIKVFLIFVMIANTLNLLIYNLGILNGETFNMFYISPYFISTLPVFDMIQEHVPYIVYLITYVWIIIIGASIIFGVSFLFDNNKNY